VSSRRRLASRFVPLLVVLLAALEGGWKWDQLLH
jgi:hypothetical protein